MLAASVSGSRLARDAGKLTAAELAVMLGGLLQAIVAARVLGPTRYGTAALILAYPMFVYTVFDPRASEAVVKYLGEAVARGDADRSLAVPKLAYLIDGALASVGLAVVAATTPWAADRVVGSGSEAPLLILWGVAVAVAAPSHTSRAILTTLGRFSSLAWVQGVAGAGRAALVITLVSMDTGVAGVIWGTAAGTVAEGAVMAVLAHRALARRTGRSWLHGGRSALHRELHGMGRFLLYTDLTSLVAVFVKQADLVILGYARGPIDAGWYRLARSLTTPVAAVVGALQAVAYPRFARLVGVGDLEGVTRTARRYLLRVGLPLGAASLLGLLLVRPAIRVVAGPEYLPATAAARWLLAGSAFILVFFWIRPAMFATGQVRFVFGVSAVTAAGTVMAFVLTAEPFGAAGIAASRALVAGIAGTGFAAMRFHQLSRSGRLRAERRRPLV